MMNLIDRHVRTRQTAWWADLLLFKGCWLALVLFQDNGVVPAAVLIGLKMLFWPATPHMLAFSVVVLIAGIGMDLALVGLGFFRFDAILLPPWLVMLWLAFALTMPRAFACIGNLHPRLQAACGMLGGLVGYLAGYFAGAVDFGYSLLFTATVIALCWAALAPLLFLADRKMPGP